jgi:hypothetical protein
MFIKFLIYMLNRTFNKNRKQLEPCIKELYRRMACENLNIKAEIVKVKKGKRRYDLMFFETPEGNIKFNLGRHWESKHPMIADVYN